MKKSLLALSVLSLASAPAWAESIQKILVEGNKRIEEQTVRSYLSLYEGAEYSAENSRKAVKSLYATGLFDDVKMTWNEGTLVVEVQENPVINRVVFEGLDELGEEQLKKLVELKERGVYNPGKVQKDVSEILSAYRAAGHFLASVEPQIIRRDQNRVDVIYKIDEGEKTEIRSIRFVGNQDYTDGKLRDVVSTKESAWWRFFGSADSYDPDRMEYDKELLRRFYVKNGYADFKVNSAVAELSRDKEGFFMTFSIHEGKVYTVNDVTIQAADVDVPQDELYKQLTIKSGQIYNGLQIESNVDALIDYLGSHGFAFTDVYPRVKKDFDAGTIDIVFTLRPGPRVYVNRINIKGNDRTRDHVIRRQMRLAEGDAFSTSKLQRSEDRLKYLDYFEEVDVERTPTDYPDKIDLDVNVKEQSTGEFQIAAGVSSYEGFLATADVKEKNFLGKGQNVGLSFALSGRRKNFNLSFTEPYFMDQELSAGFDLFNEVYDYQDQSSYDQATQGGRLRFGFPIDEYSSNLVALTLQKKAIEDVDDDASQFIKDEEGERNMLMISNTYRVDTRDSYIMPTKGYNYSLGVDYAGLGSDVDFIRTDVKGSYHIPFWDKWTFSVGGRAGAIIETGSEIPLFDLYRAGGQTLRGFDLSGIGPRDATTKDALGGQYMLGNNLEVRFPLGKLDESGVKGFVFSDGGIVTEFKNDNPNVVDDQTYRISVGAGIFWRSPLGPLRFEFGFPVVKAEDDETQVFSFSVGSSF